MPPVTPDLLLRAYACGLFPMSESRRDPRLFWVDPDMRGILPLDRFHVPRRLARRVRKAQEYGVGDFAMVHDSYGTLAADCNILFQALRAAFVEMYEDNDVFAQFKEALDGSLDAPLPEPPARGDLDLMRVMESDFFFA